MKRLTSMRFLVPLIASLTFFQPAIIGQTSGGKTPAAEASDPHRALVNTYCFTCHNSRLKTAGLALDALNFQAPAHDARTWEKVLRKLRGRLMPPPGMPQPSQ